MFLQNTYNYALGYAKIRIEGFFTERFINLCMNRNIKIWNIKNESECRIILNIKIAELQNIDEIANITRTNVEILEKKGIPQIAKAYKNRKIFMGLFFVVLILIYLLSKRVWDIEIVGNFSIPIAEIENELLKEEVKLGMRKEKIDFDRIKNNIYLRRKDILWMGFEIKGTKVVIEIVERTNKKEDEFQSRPCNIIANKDRSDKKN